MMRFLTRPMLCLLFGATVIVAPFSGAIAEDTRQPKGAPPNLPASLSEIKNCTDPVIMVVIGKLSENGFEVKPDGRSYADELIKSGLYKRFGGQYLLGYPLLETFENPYPADAFTLVAEWPCLEAAQGFYYSPEYQEIIPLRDGAGTFQFAVFPKNDFQDVPWEADKEN